MWHRHTPTRVIMFLLIHVYCVPKYPATRDEGLKGNFHHRKSEEHRARTGQVGSPALSGAHKASCSQEAEENLWSPL